MRAIIIALVFPYLLIAQGLPTFVLGAGEEWSRGSTSKFGTDVTVADLISNTKFYVYGNIFTPDQKGFGGQPTASIITAGGAYAAAQSGRLTLLIILQSGFSLTTAASAAVPAFSGSVAVPISITRTFGIMPFVKCLATTPAPVLNASGVNTVIQIGLQAQYSFRSAPISVSPTTITAKKMRAVMRRVLGFKNRQ